MSDTLIPGLLKKLQELEKYAADEKHARGQIVSKIIKIEQWLVGDRSLVQHRCAQAFITYLWKSYGKDTRENFYDYCKELTGFIITEKRKANIEGKIVYFEKIKYKSLSFSKCSQKVHNKFFTDLQEIALFKWGVDFSKWLKEWNQNEHLIG